MPQSVHAPPAVPQLPTAAVWQALLEQQPFGHETESHTQLPPVQCCPTGHAEPAPHAQLPPLEQPSARPMGQVTQLPPPLPQALTEGGLQVAPVQHPLGQLVPSHMHAPAMQRWPAPHAAPDPQVQLPAAEQPSATFASQPTQAAPPVPQVVRAGGLQVAPEQQPFGQLVELQPLHVPFVQVWPPGQVWQAPPPVPHEGPVSPGRQLPFEQHPVGHDVPSHTQVLPMQRWPGAQAAAPPQRQVPADEQLSARSSQVTHVDPASPQVASERVSQVFPWQQPLGHDVLSQVQRPERQRWPPAHACLEPQAQVPVALQWSALVASHAAQAPPPMPQAASDGGLLHMAP